MGPFRSVRSRLLAGSFAVVAVFALASSLTIVNRRELQRALDQMRDRAEGIRASLTMASAAREAYVHVAHVIIDKDGLEHAEHVEDAEKEFLRWKAIVATKLSDEDDRAQLARLESESARFSAIFDGRIVPAVRAKDSHAIHEAHHELEEVVTKLLRENDALSERLAERIALTFAESNALAERATRRDSLLLVLAAALALLVSFVTSRGVVRPIGLLIDSTRRISKGALGHEVDVQDRGELGDLASGLNAMSRELRSRYLALVQAERLASIGRVAAGVAHELNNPLGVILGYVLTLAKEAAPGSQLEDDLKTVEGEVRQAQRIVQGLLELVRPVAVDLEPIDLADLARAELSRTESAGEGSKVTIEDALPAKLSARGDAGRVRQVLANLLRNAVEAMPAGGRLRVGGDPASDRPTVTIDDTGIGLTPEQLGRIFEPFFTTKPKGTGLGLSISYGIVKALGGDLRVESEPGKGTRFTLVLPAASA